MKHLLYFLIIAALFVACEESELTMFSSKDALYFDLNKDAYRDIYSDPDKGDSTTVTFGGIDPTSPEYEKFDTLWVRVKVLGTNSPIDRNFVIEANEELSTAVEGINYEAFKESYKFTADSFYVEIPLIILNDENLKEEEVVNLYVDIVSNENFDKGLEKNHQIKIKILNDVVKPDIYDYWLYWYFGPYSKVKHRLIMELNGGIPIPDNMDDYWTLRWDGSLYYWKTLLVTHLEENDVYDENGELIPSEW